MPNIGQICYNVIDTSSSDGNKGYISSGINIYNDIVNAYGARQFTKVGIQAPPGAQVVMNNNKTIMIGRTGIYELDEDIAITSLKFVQPRNYVKDDKETDDKKIEGEEAIKLAKQNLEKSIAALTPPEEGDRSSNVYKAYWNGYNQANETYIAAYQEASNTLSQGLNGVYKLDPKHPEGDLENVIIDFIYDAAQS